MEYATREQAQQAVAQLSNQNLMGRLVYVREVCGVNFRPGRRFVKVGFRTVRRNLDSSALLGAAPVADSLAVECLAALIQVTAVAPPVVVVVKYT